MPAWILAVMSALPLISSLATEGVQLVHSIIDDVAAGNTPSDASLQQLQTHIDAAKATADSLDADAAKL